MLIGKSSDSSGFPLLLSGPLTLCPLPYNHKCTMLSGSLNKTFPSFLTIKLILKN